MEKTNFTVTYGPISYGIKSNLCGRCGRNDLELLSNGLCTRCDDALYGKKESMVKKPIYWSNQ